VKHDYPSRWSSAFQDVLQLGYNHGLAGIDLVARILRELEIEVVMFTDSRSRSEHAQNIVVKDAMRDSDVIFEIVTFLCKSAEHCLLHAQRTDLCSICLRCLGDLILWVDANIVIQTALPVVYQIWQTTSGGSGTTGNNETAAVRAACLGCFFSLVKKGMDPLSKVKLLHTIGIIPSLSGNSYIQHMLVATSTSSNNNAMVKKKKEEEEEEEEGEQENQQLELTELAQLVDALVVEMLGCWCKYEDLAERFVRSQSNADTVAQLQEVSEAVPVVVDFLTVLIPQLLLPLLQSSYLRVFCAVLPACGRLVAVLRQQLQRQDVLHFLSTSSSNNISSSGTTSNPNETSASVFFIAEQYLDELLMGIYVKSQYPIGFDFEAADEEATGAAGLGIVVEHQLNEDVEARNEIRKLFVNCCRVKPGRCLEMLAAVMSAQPQPLSSAPFPALDAALRLLYAYVECGNINLNLNPGGSGARQQPVDQALITTFSAIVNALQDTDIAQHAHPQVVLAYFDVSLRYIRFLSALQIQHLFQLLLGPCGVLSTCTSVDHSKSGANKWKGQSNLVRSRACYIVLKVAEAPESKPINLIDAAFPLLKGILAETAAVELNSGFQGPSPLSRLSEQYLCEALALLASASAVAPGSNTSNKEASVEKLRIVAVDIQLTQLQRAMPFIQQQQQQRESHIHDHSMVESQLKLVVDFITQRVTCLAALCRGFTFKTHATAVPMFEIAAAAVVTVAQQLSHGHGHGHNGILVTKLVWKPLRGKILIYLHRLVACIHTKALQYAQQVIPYLLSGAEINETEEVVQVLNQLMVEFGSQCLPVVDALFLLIMNKYQALLPPEMATAATTGISSQLSEAPHIATERHSLHRQRLQFIQHVATYDCAATLACNPVHIPLLQEILQKVVLDGIAGGSSTRTSNETTSAAAAAAAAASPLDVGGVQLGAEGITEGTHHTCKKYALQDTVPLRKHALAIVNSLVTAWLLPTTTTHTHASNATCTPSMEVVDAFRRHLLQEVLPLAMLTISPFAATTTNTTTTTTTTTISHRAAREGVIVNVLDAAAQSVLVEIAVLIRNTRLLFEHQQQQQSHSTFDKTTTPTPGINAAGAVAAQQYFQSLLLPNAQQTQPPAASTGNTNTSSACTAVTAAGVVGVNYSWYCCWPEPAVTIFLELLVAPVPLGTFKDEFKKFVRHCARVYNK